MRFEGGRHLAIDAKIHVDLDSANRQGRTGARPSSVTAQQLEAAELVGQDGHSLRAIAATRNVSASTME